MRPDMALVLGGVDLVKGNIRDVGSILVEITTELNPFLVRTSFLQDAPFKLLNIIIRFGTRLDAEPDCERISKRYNELPFAVEIDIAPLRKAKREEVKAAILNALIPSLFRIADKYKLPTTGLVDYCRENGIG